MTSSLAAVMSSVNRIKWLCLFVSFKLNNADFPSLPFPSIFYLCFISLCFIAAITAYKSFSGNVNIGSSLSLAIATSIPISSVPHILQGTFFRNSHQRSSIEKAVFESFAIFTGKHPCWSLFLVKLQAFRTDFISLWLKL